MYIRHCSSEVLSHIGVLQRRGAFSKHVSFAKRQKTSIDCSSYTMLPPYRCNRFEILATQRTIRVHVHVRFGILPLSRCARAKSHGINSKVDRDLLRGAARVGQHKCIFRVRHAAKNSPLISRELRAVLSSRARLSPATVGFDRASGCTGIYSRRYFFPFFLFSLVFHRQ